MERSRFRWFPQFLKLALSSLAVALGVIAGIFGVAIASNVPAFGDGVGTDGARAAAVALFGFIALLGSVAALRRPRRAAILFLVAAPAMGTFDTLSSYLRRPNGGVSLEQLALEFLEASVMLAIPGLFWLMTSRAGWRPLIPIRTIPGKPMRRFPLIEPLLFGTFVAVGLFSGLTLQRFGEDCYKVSPPISGPQFRDQVVFTARVLFVAHPSPWPEGFWSVVRVQRRFWGLPAWAPNYVLLRGYPFDLGDRAEHLVDARRSRGLLTHFLPIVEIYPCCHTEPLDRATVDLRVLRDGPPKSGVRIIGRVDNSEFVTSEPVRGVRVLIAGPGGNISTTTDQQGIYNLVGLPAGHYSVQVESESQQDHFYGKAQSDVKSGEVWGARLVAHLVQPVSR